MKLVVLVQSSRPRQPDLRIVFDPTTDMQERQVRVERQEVDALGELAWVRHTSHVRRAGVLRSVSAHEFAMDHRGDAPTGPSPGARRARSRGTREAAESPLDAKGLEVAVADHGEGALMFEPFAEWQPDSVRSTRNYDGDPGDEDGGGTLRDVSPMIPAVWIWLETPEWRCSVPRAQRLPKQIIYQDGV